MRCAGVPKPPEEKVNLSGSLFSSATSSATDFAGTEGFTTRTLYETDALTTGARSLSRSKSTFGSKAGAAIIGTPVTRSEYPSAFCLRMSATPMDWIAPGRFSTTTRQPSLSESSAAMTRLIMSGGVLEPVGTTILIIFDGNGWAAASRALATAHSESSDIPIREKSRNECKVIISGSLAMMTDWLRPVAVDDDGLPKRSWPQENQHIPQRGMLSSAERNVNIRRFRWETRAKWKNRQQSEVWNVGSKCSNCCNPIPFCRCMNFTSRPEYQSKVCFESWPLWNNQD